MSGRKPKIQKHARNITIRDGDEVYTRLSKREYEKRRDMFDDEANQETFWLRRGGDYDDYVNWGSQGGRPTKWTSEAERKRTERAQKKAGVKLASGQLLTKKERELLGLVKKRPGAYQSPLGRPMTPAERKARWKSKQGGNM